MMKNGKKTVSAVFSVMTAVLSALNTQAVSTNRITQSEREYLAAVITVSCEGKVLSERVQLAGKIIDMAENAGYPDSIADAVTALYSSGEITGIGKISETDRTSKEYRLSLDAVDAALGGNRI